MRTSRLVRLIVLSFSFAFVITAAAGPVVAAVACAAALISALATGRNDAVRRAEAAESEAVATPEAEAAEAVVAEAEAVIVRALLRLSGEAAW